MAKSARLLLAFGLAALIFGGPLAYSTYRDKQTRNFRIIHPGVIYRSGQMTLSGLDRMMAEYRIKTVITLRAAEREGDAHPDLEEETFCRAQGINYVRLNPRKWWAKDDEPVPAQVNVDTFLKVVEDPANQPVLVHCFAGMHRTGAYCAIYRIEHDGWSKEDAIKEMKRLGYRNLEKEGDVLGYLESYVPRRERK